MGCVIPSNFVKFVESILLFSISISFSLNIQNWKLEMQWEYARSSRKTGNRASPKQRRQSEDESNDPKTSSQLGQFYVKTHHYRFNPLLERVQMIVEVYFAGRANVNHAELTRVLGRMYKVLNYKMVFLFGFRNKFGDRSKSTGFALIYKSITAALKYEPRHRLIRSNLIKNPKNSLLRFERKEAKNKKKKVWGVTKKIRIKG